MKPFHGKTQTYGRGRAAPDANASLICCLALCLIFSEGSFSELIQAIIQYQIHLHPYWLFVFFFFLTQGSSVLLGITNKLASYQIPYQEVKQWNYYIFSQHSYALTS